MPKATFNDLEIEYETFGSASSTPVLLIMGLGAQMVVWPDRFCELLSEEGYYVIRFDNRDIGLSTKLENHSTPHLVKQLFANWFDLKIDAPYNLYHMAEDAVMLLDHLGCDKAHVVGASMGGMIAQIIASIYHHRILSLTSIMSAADSRSLLMPWNIKRGMNLLNSSRQSGRTTTQDEFEVKLETVKFFSSRTHPPHPEELERRLRIAFERDREELGTRRQLSAIVATNAQRSLTKSVNVPTLVIHGDEDRIIPLKFGKKNAELIDQAEFREIEGMAHDFPRPLVGYLAFLISKHLRKTDQNRD